MLTDEIYIVRQNDKNESIVTFGDGVLGSKAEYGVVVAYYRFGGGAMLRLVRSPNRQTGQGSQECSQSRACVRWCG